MANISICSIEGCGKTHLARGWCPAHYRRWIVHSDPLNSGPGTPKGEVKRHYREVVLTDERGSGDPCLIWPFATNKQGYAIFTNRRDGGTGLVGRRLCEDANGPPPTPDHEAAHSCGNGRQGCVTKRHLTWKTHAENMADMLVHGTRVRGERIHSAKLTEAEVREIRALKGKLLQREIAAAFDIHQNTVSRVLSGVRWGWLDG